MRALVLVLLIFCGKAAFAQQLPKTPIKEVNSGEIISFDKACVKGHVTLITVWGTWCAHGKREVKSISGNLTAWKQQADFSYITIASDEHGPHPEELVRSYVHAQGWTFPCYVDPESDLKRLLHYTALPYTIIIDKTGGIAFTHTGYDSKGLILAKLKEVSRSVKK